MLKKLMLVLCASLLSIVTAAQESVLPYSYIEAGYVLGETLGKDSVGFRLKGSKSINHFLYASASYTSLLSDDPVTDFNGVPVNDELDRKQMDVGIGVHTVIDEVPDFIAEIHYVNHDTSAGAESESDSGYRGTLGFRLPGGDNYEVVAMINHTRIGGERETGFELGGRMRAGESNSLGLGFNKTFDVEVFRLDFRIGL
ncbi:MAG: hypothetical protein HKO07_03845 [Pseudomonadales bacterium]|nr:hypothetical protein [Pseudomonadales bacterium]